MQDFAYFVDDLDVDIPWNIVTGTLYRPAVSIRSFNTTIPGRSGYSASSAPTLFEAPTLTLVFSLQRLPGVTLETAINNLVGAFVRPGDVRIRRVAEGLTTYANARLVSISEPDALFVGAVAKLTVTLSIPGVFFRSEVITSSPITAGGDVTTDLPDFYGGTGPITDATVRIKGPGQIFTIRDKLTNTGVIYYGALSASDYAFINLDTLTARRTTSETAWDSGGDNVTGLFDYPAAGPLALWPAAASYDPRFRPISMSVNGQGRSSGTQVTIRGRKAYL